MSGDKGKGKQRMTRKTVASEDFEPEFKVILKFIGFIIHPCQNCRTCTCSHLSYSHTLNCYPQRALIANTTPVVFIISDDEEAGPSGTWGPERPRSPLLAPADRAVISWPVARVEGVPLVRRLSDIENMREAAAQRERAFSNPASENFVAYRLSRYGANRPNMIRVLPDLPTVSHF